MEKWKYFGSYFQINFFWLIKIIQNTLHIFRMTHSFKFSWIHLQPASGHLELTALWYVQKNILGMVVGKSVIVITLWHAIEKPAA